MRRRRHRLNRPHADRKGVPRRLQQDTHGAVHGRPRHQACCRARQASSPAEVEDVILGCAAARGHDRLQRRPRGSAIRAGAAGRDVSGVDRQPLLLVRACRPSRWRPSASWSWIKVPVMIAGGLESVSAWSRPRRAATRTAWSRRRVADAGACAGASTTSMNRPPPTPSRKRLRRSAVSTQDEYSHWQSQLRTAAAQTGGQVRRRDRADGTTYDAGHRQRTPAGDL